MISFLDFELQRFKAFCGQTSRFYEIAEVGPEILKVSPRQQGSSGLTLGFLGVVHGNEVLGLPVLNQILQNLLSGPCRGSLEFYFAIGNLPAARLNRRFVEVDLNRSFGRNSHEFLETRRALELQELMLKPCDYVLDFHQTVCPTKNPFFILEYSQGKTLDFVQQINPGWPTVLQFEAIGDESGLSSDEYLLRQGKVGVALELGQMGSTDYLIDGISTGLRAIDVLEGLGRKSSISNPMLQIADRFRAPTLDSRLLPGFENFNAVRLGQQIGLCSLGPLIAPQSGMILFPKYSPVQEIGQELYYLCTEFEKGASLLCATQCANPV